jgi:hypothetical protein
MPLFLPYQAPAQSCSDARSICLATRMFLFSLADHNNGNNGGNIYDKEI